MNKRITSVGLSALMTVGMLAGCSSKTSSSSTSSADSILNNEETINLTVFSQLANWSGAQTGWGATLLKDKFNIELNIIPDTSGAYQTRMESGDLGDIVVWGNNGDQYQSAVSKDMNLGVNLDILPEGASLAGYSVVIVPTHFVVDNDVVAALEEFVSNGGAAIITNRSGVKDKNGNCIFGESLPTKFSKLCGCHIIETDGIGEAQYRIRSIHASAPIDSIPVYRKIA